MFEKIKEDFYKSLAKSIKDRIKKELKLKRTDVLNEPTRVSNIINAKRNEHHPYLIGKNEYAYLYYLYLFDDKESFLHEKILSFTVDEHIKKSGNNYDKMLWGHIKWEEMFKNIIVELSELNLSNSMGKLFEDTLMDYVPYAIIRYDELNPVYGKVYIFPDDRKKRKQDAIHWVHLRFGSDFFKKTFLEVFKGKTLKEFDLHFNKFITQYLEKKLPNEYSLGLQAYNFHKNVSEFSAYWQSLAEVQYGEMNDKKSDLEKLLEEYLRNGRIQMQKLEKYQQDFDSFNIDIK